MDIDDGNELANYITDRIMGAANAAIPRKTDYMKRPPVPWWTAECQRAKRKRAERALMQNYNIYNKIPYNRAKAACKKTFNRAKRRSWEGFVNTINSRTQMKEVWSKIKKISGKCSMSPSPVLEENGRQIAEPKQIAEALAQHFSTIRENINRSQEFLRHKNQIESLLIRIVEDDTKPYNCAITYAELQRCLSSTKEPNTST